MVANSVGEQVVRVGELANAQSITVQRNVEHAKPELLKALVAAQKEIGNAAKSGENKYDRYSYATLEDYLNAVKEPCSNNGLVIAADMVGNPDYGTRKTAKGNPEVVARVQVLTTLMHVDGGYMSVLVVGEGQDRGDKALYKAYTGGRKYGIAMLFGIYTTDDAEVDSPDNGGQPAAPKPPLQGRQQPPTTQWTEEEQAKLIGYFKTLGSTEEKTAQERMDDAVGRMEANQRLRASKRYLGEALEAFNTRLDQLCETGDISDEGSLDLHTRGAKLVGMTTADKLPTNPPQATETTEQ